jgi:hypothetical protein
MRTSPGNDEAFMGINACGNAHDEARGMIGGTDRLCPSSLRRTCRATRQTSGSVSLSCMELTALNWP